MNEEQLKKEYMNCLENNELSETERIDKLKELQENIHDLNDILGIDSDTRIQYLEEAKRQLKDDQILNSYIVEENSDVDKTETVKRN